MPVADPQLMLAAMHTLDTTFINVRRDRGTSSARVQEDEETDSKDSTPRKQPARRKKQVTLRAALDSPA